MKTLFAIIAAVTISGVALISAPAHAQAPVQPATAKVAYADLDLDTAQGRRTLERRVAGAVRQVCPDRPMPREMLKTELWRSCIASARQGADVQLAALFGGERKLAANVIQVTGQSTATAR